MTNKKTVPRTFRAWPENEDQLEFAKSVGLDLSDVVNKCLSKYLKPTLEAETKKMRETLAAPVP